MASDLCDVRTLAPGRMAVQLKSDGFRGPFYTLPRAGDPVQLQTRRGALIQDRFPRPGRRRAPVAARRTSRDTSPT
ncbi:DNA ligase-like domain-containing protein [Streptomyces atroolivaceus]|uniref:hypothetical protein n=1 Tax=Streptomyces atroolivaceus TaxID=66869 RepID=UPI00362C474C